MSSVCFFQSSRKSVLMKTILDQKITIFPATFFCRPVSLPRSKKRPAVFEERTRHVAVHTSALGPRTYVKPYFLLPSKMYFIRMCVVWQQTLFNRQHTQVHGDASCCLLNKASFLLPIEQS